MKLLSFEHRGRSSWGVLHSDDTITDIGALPQAPSADLSAALAAGLTVESLAQLLAEVEGEHRVPRSDTRALLPLTSPGKILCIGSNYADHIQEMAGRTRQPYPVVFTRFVDSLVPDGAELQLPEISEQFDYEAELVAVIGRPTRRVSVAEALDSVLGYSIMNEGSVREYQRHTHQFTPGKNFLRSGAFGPWIVTADEYGLPDRQSITASVNGEQRQHSTLDLMIFSVAEIISYCSEWTELRPGDIIATGTPAGVGAGKEPPQWLRAGDSVRIEIEGIGVLSNTVSADSA